MKTLVYFVISTFYLSVAGAQHPAGIIWADPNGDSRQEVVYFRKEVELSATPKEAMLHVFADARYQLKVNGVEMGFGPVRFYPHEPFYDSYDLRPWLKKGENTIAVKVLSPGINTYQTPRSRGGFIAWGSILQSDNRKLSLATPGKWLCKRAQGYDANAPKMTFALGIMEIFDFQKDPDDWADPHVNPDDWKQPVLVKDPSYWGKILPRQIPPLTNNIVTPQALLGAYQLSDQEALYSFRLKTIDYNKVVLNQKYPALAYTYIYSPRAQSIPCGMWWGNYWLNGEPLSPLENVPNPVKNGRANWQTYTLELDAGWNYLFIKQDFSGGFWDFYLAIPQSAQVYLSVEQMRNGPISFRSLLGMTESDQQILRSVDRSMETPTQLTTHAKWQDHHKENTANNPAWEIAWRPLAQKLPCEPQQTREIQLQDSIGNALVFDFGGKQLGTVFIEFEAPAGTTFDLGYSEDLLGEKIFMLKRSMLMMGTRFVTNGKATRFETFNPYGFRYLQINIHGAKGKIVKVKQVGIHSRVYPLEKKGQFSCSDPLLNEIWELGWRTLKVCSEDTYIDTPFRERGVYAGDALPEYALTLVTNGDSRLLKQSLITLKGLYQHLFEKNIPASESFSFGAHDDYPLIMVQALEWYGLHTQDWGFVRTQYPQYQNLIEQYRQHCDTGGIYHAQMRPFIEWTQIDKSADTLIPLQLFLARAYQSMASMASVLNLPQESKRYHAYFEELAQNLRRISWDASRKAYIDGYKKGKSLTSRYPITSALASLYEVATPEQSQDLLEHLIKEMADIGTESRKQKTSTYGSFYVLETLYKYEAAAAAEQFIRKNWGPMVWKHNDTAWENFDAEGIGTLSHAWSGHPTYFLSTQVLGVQLEYPSRKASTNAITIAPQSETLHWAKGKVPHPKGLIEVEWKVVGQDLFLSCSAPSGVVYHVKPRGRLAFLRLWVNGKQVEQ